jgi:predicted transcriptional regulator
MSHRQIAALLGVTHTAVQKILQEAGWRRDILGRINARS